MNFTAKNFFRGDRSHSLNRQSLKKSTILFIRGLKFGLNCLTSYMVDLYQRLTSNRGFTVPTYFMKEKCLLPKLLASGSKGQSRKSFFSFLYLTKLFFFRDMFFKMHFELMNHSVLKQQSKHQIRSPKFQKNQKYFS